MQAAHQSDSLVRLSCVSLNLKHTCPVVGATAPIGVWNTPGKVSCVAPAPHHKLMPAASCGNK